MFGWHVEPYDAIGFIGVCMYISGYALLQLHVLDTKGYRYTLINLCAASLVLLSLSHTFNMSSAIIQITYIFLSLLGLTRLLYIHFYRRLNEEERHLAQKMLPSLSEAEAFLFIQHGEIIHQPKGTTLTQEGKPVEHLAFIIEGSAEVLCKYCQIAIVRSGHFIGEITCHDGKGATGTVITCEPSKLFTIKADKLRLFLKKHPALLPHLEYAIADNLRNKLAAGNNSQTVITPIAKHA